MHDVPPSIARFTPGAERIKPLVRVSHWHEFKPNTEIATRVRHGRFVQIWSVAPDGVTLTATAEPLRATPELLARASADLAASRALHPRLHRLGWEHHQRFHDPHIGKAGDFVPGALRPSPLVHQARDTYPPNTQIHTTIDGRRFVQAWQVGADGVTLTATAFPLKATPELLAQADRETIHHPRPHATDHHTADRPLAAPSHAAPHPHPSGVDVAGAVKGASSIVSGLSSAFGGGGSGGGAGGGDTAGTVGNVIGSAAEALSGALGGF